MRSLEKREDKYKEPWIHNRDPYRDPDTGFVGSSLMTAKEGTFQHFHSKLGHVQASLWWDVESEEKLLWAILS